MRCRHSAMFCPLIAFFTATVAMHHSGTFHALSYADSVCSALSSFSLYTSTCSLIEGPRLTTIFSSCSTLVCFLEQSNSSLSWFALLLIFLMALCSDNLSFFFSFPNQLGFKMFLGVTATVTNWDAEGTTCSFVLEDNPLVDFVELPDTCQGLQYCNVLSGVIRGALEMVRLLLLLSFIISLVKLYKDK